MIAKFLTVAGLITASVTSATAQGPQNTVAPAATMPIEEILERGKQLYHYDQAAWHSTDLLQANAKDLNKLSLAGRVVVPVNNGWQAIYFGKDGRGRFAIFTAVWTGTEMVEPRYFPDSDGPLLSEQANAMADVVDMLIEGKIDMKGIWFCNKAQPNFVILPGGQSGEFLFYLMTAQTELKSYPFGGHHRIDIGNGKEVGRRKFSNSCLDLSTADKDETMEAFYISHIIDPTPTEIHVFTAMAAKSDVIVGTTENKKSWLISPGMGSSTVTEIDLDAK
jgi:hypothetical protein